MATGLEVLGGLEGLVTVRSIYMPGGALDSVTGLEVWEVFGGLEVLEEGVPPRPPSASPPFPQPWL